MTQKLIKMNWKNQKDTQTSCYIIKDNSEYKKRTKTKQKQKQKKNKKKTKLLI